MQLCPYLNFPGTTEQAMRFYEQALGGTLDEIHRFGTMPGADQMPAEVHDKVMHVTLRLAEGFLIMASDALEGMGPPHSVGTNVSLSLHPSSKEEADQFFAALSEGGTVTMPLADQFWGDYYGMLTDKFGVQWMINYNAENA